MPSMRACPRRLCAIWCAMRLMSLADVLPRSLLDILDTPVSPELLPPTGDGEIARRRLRDLVGPY